VRFRVYRRTDPWDFNDAEVGDPFLRQRVCLVFNIIEWKPVEIQHVRIERSCKMRFVFEEQVRTVYGGSRLDNRVSGEHVGRQNCRVAVYVA